MVISMLKIRRPLGRLIFNMGIAITGKTVFLIETAPWVAILLKRDARLIVNFFNESRMKLHKQNFLHTLIFPMLM